MMSPPVNSPPPTPPPPVAPPGSASEGQRRLVDDAATADIRGSSARSGLLMLVSRGVQSVVTVACMMVLARWLDVADFGVFAMAGVFASLVLCVNTLGLWMAVIQRQELTDDAVQRSFRLSLRVNLVLASGLVVASPILAWFYGEPVVLPITCALAVGVFFNGVSAVPDGLLKREMRYGLVSGVETLACVLSAAAALGAAWLGWGPWSLVAQQVVQQGGGGLGRWWAAGWWPRLGRLAEDERDLEGAGALARYGWHFSWAKLVRVFGRNFGQVAVGRIAGAGPLGLYNAAYRWAVFPVENIHQPLMSVCVSSFSRLQNDPPRLRQYVRRAFGILYSLTLPILAMLFVEAEGVILLLLGDKWLAAIPIFRWLLIGMAAEMALLLNKYIYYSDGRTDTQAKWTLVEAGVMTVGVAVGAAFGLAGSDAAVGVSAGHALAAWSLVLPSGWVCARGSLVMPWDLLRPGLRPAAAAVTGALVIAALNPWLPNSASVLSGDPSWVVPLASLLDLSVSGVIFFAVYAGVWLTLPRGVTEARALCRLAQTLRGGSSTARSTAVLQREGAHAASATAEGAG